MATHAGCNPVPFGPVGSTPTPSTLSYKAPSSSLVRTPPSQGGNARFKSGWGYRTLARGATWKRTRLLIGRLWVRSPPRLLHYI